MKSSKPNKFISPKEIEVEIAVNKDILFLDKQPSTSTSISANMHKRPNLTHKKINSANNKFTRFHYHKHLNKNQHPNPFSDFGFRDESQRISTIQTPEISTKFQLKLEKLNSSISSLNNQYSELIKQHFKTNKKRNEYKMRFIHIKKKDEEERRKQKKEKYLNLKEIQKKENHEKIQKMKDDYHKSKKKELKEKSLGVKLLKNQEKISLKNYKESIKMAQMKKQKIKEEEKKCIEDGLIKQNNIKKNEIIKRKIIQKEKDQKNAELIQNKQIYVLKRRKKDLEEKVKIQKTINDKTKKELYKDFHYKLNYDVLKNTSTEPEIEIMVKIPNEYILK